MSQVAIIFAQGIAHEQIENAVAEAAKHDVVLIPIETDDPYAEVKLISLKGDELDPTILTSESCCCHDETE